MSLYRVGPGSTTIVSHDAMEYDEALRVCTVLKSMYQFKDDPVMQLVVTPSTEIVYCVVGTLYGIWQDDKGYIFYEIAGHEFYTSRQGCSTVDLERSKDMANDFSIKQARLFKGTYFADDDIVEIKLVRYPNNREFEENLKLHKLHCGATFTARVASCEDDRVMELDLSTALNSNVVEIEYRMVEEVRRVELVDSN